MSRVENTSNLSLSDQAYNVLKDRIITREIESGDLILESRVAEELGMSRTPVRSAINKLESEGIVEVRDGIGAFVKILSLKEVRDMFEIRKELELLALETSIYSIPLNEIEELQEDIELIKKKVNENHLITEEFVKVDNRVHDLIVSYSSNEYLQKLYYDMRFRLIQYQYISFENISDVRRSIIEHCKILDLLKERDKEKLKPFLADHIEWSLMGIS